MKNFYIILFVIVFTLSSESQQITHWNVGVGGNTARNSLVTINGPQQPTVLWEGGLYAKRGYQTFIEGDVVVASRRHDYNNTLHGAKIVAHDIHTGDTLWTTELPVINPDIENFSQVKGVCDGQVYCTRAGGPSNESIMYAHNIFTGEIIWQTTTAITQSYSEDFSFAGNGDIIVGNFNNIIRVDKNNGNLVWSVSRSSPTTDGSAVAVYGGKVYGWEASVGGPRISAYDIETGEYLYSSDAIAPGWVQQTGIMISPDGTIYAPRVQNNPDTDFFVSLTDNGEEIKENWSVEYGYALWASYGVGPDGTVYTYDRDRHVIRLNPTSGEILNTSIEFCSEYPAGPKMAIGADGIIYLTNGKYGESKLFSFNPDLTLRWTEDFGNTVVEGPSIAYDGTMIVCAGNYLFRAYQAENPPQLIADFSADSTFGIAPFTVSFSDKSVGINSTISSWEWDFDNDGLIDSYDQNPSYVFQEAGSYSVYLKISNATLEDTVIKTDYIQVSTNTNVQFAGYSRPVVFPNPAKDFIYIRTPEIQISVFDISISDMTGRRVLNTLPENNGSKIKIDISTLEPGMYIVKIHYADGSVNSNKIVIKQD